MWKVLLWKGSGGKVGKECVWGETGGLACHFRGMARKHVIWSSKARKILNCLTLSQDGRESIPWVLTLRKLVFSSKIIVSICSNEIRGFKRELKLLIAFISHYKSNIYTTESNFIISNNEMYH